MAKTFSEKIRQQLDLSGYSQSEAADVLEIDRKTLESWVAGSGKSWGRIPHKLVQVGAIATLNRSRGGMNGGYIWEVTKPDGTMDIVQNLTHWIKKTFPNKNINSVQSGFSKRGKYGGFIAKKIIVE